MKFSKILAVTAGVSEVATGSALPANRTGKPARKQIVSHAHDRKNADIVNLRQNGIWFSASAQITKADFANIPAGKVPC